MPKAAAQPYKTRRPIEAQETFRYTTPTLHPAARPVEMFVRPSPTTSALLTAIAGAQELIKGYAKYKELKNQEDIERAQTLAITGQELPQGASNAMVEAYDEIRGRAHVYDLHQKALEYFHQNKTMDPESFRAGLNELIKGYTEGKSTAFLKGFVPKAMEVENQLIKHYIEAQQAEIKENLLTNVQATVRHELEVTKTDDPKKLRELLTDLQNKAKTLKVNRSDVTDAFVKSIYTQAVMDAKPELLRVLFEPDPSGITIADAIGPDRAMQLVKAAENAKEAKIAAAEAAARKAQENYQKQITKELYTRLFTADETDPNALMRLQHEIIAHQNVLSPSTYAALLRTLDGKMGVGGFPKTSDPMLLRTMRVEAERGTLDEDILLAYQDRLSYEDFAALLAKTHQTREQAENETIREYRAMREEFEQAAIDGVVSRDPLGRLVGGERKARVLYWFNKFEQHERKKQNTDTLSIDTLQQIADKAISVTLGEAGAQPQGPITVQENIPVVRPIPKPQGTPNEKPPEKPVPLRLRSIQE